MERSAITLTKKAREVKSNIKAMLILFFNNEGTVHKEFVPPGQTVSSAFYVKVLRHLWENVQKKVTWHMVEQDSFSTTIKHQPMLLSRLDGFLPVTKWLWCPILPTHQTLFPTTFSCFHNWKWNWRGEDLRHLRNSSGVTGCYQHTRRKWQHYWDHCQDLEGTTVRVMVITNV